MKNLRILTHNTKVILNGRRGYVGTVAGYAFEYNEDVAIAIARAALFGHDMHWINQGGACLCSDPGYYERENAKWSGAIELTDGDLVLLDGVPMVVRYKGDFSDMGAFEPVGGDHAAE